MKDRCLNDNGIGEKVDSAVHKNKLSAPPWSIEFETDSIFSITMGFCANVLPEQ